MWPSGGNRGKTAPGWLSPADRCEVIARKLTQRRAVKVSALSSELGVSQMTIRRDLARLEAEGLLVRTYGGALAPGSPVLALRAATDRQARPIPSLDARVRTAAPTRSDTKRHAASCE
jgi:DeoR/GlpR family transcriptional regulator of sugar metabolism